MAHGVPGTAAGLLPENREPVLGRALAGDPAEHFCEIVGIRVAYGFTDFLYIDGGLLKQFFGFIYPVLCQVGGEVAAKAVFEYGRTKDG